MSNLDYKERLVLLHAETLELRRLKIDLITAYKIFFGLTDIDFKDYFAFKQDEATRGSSGHNLCSVQNIGRVDAQCNYFSVMTVTPRNSLTAATIKLNSLASFERRMN